MQYMICNAYMKITEYWFDNERGCIYDNERGFDVEREGLHLSTREGRCDEKLCCIHNNERGFASLELRRGCFRIQERELV